MIDDICKSLFNVDPIDRALYYSYLYKLRFTQGVVLRNTTKGLFNTIYILKILLACLYIIK